MPSSAEHRAKHEANRRLLDSGNNGTPFSTLDGCWAAVVAFYAALHLVDRLAARVTFHPGNHGDRLNFVRRHHPSIYLSYNALKIASEIARYGTLNLFNRTFPGNTTQTLLIDQKLVAIETYVNTFFPPPAPPAVGAGS
jgi:hypothetical protein